VTRPRIPEGENGSHRRQATEDPSPQSAWTACPLARVVMRADRT